MSRNITNLEKALILILIMGAILGLGAYLFVIPAYDEIGVVDSQIEQSERDIETAHAQLDRARVIDAEYVIKRERAENVHHDFYDEENVSDTIRLVQDILSGFRGGVEPLNGIMLNEVSEHYIDEITLALQLFTGGRDIRYELRDLATQFGAIGEGEVDAYADPDAASAAQAAEAEEAADNAMREMIKHLFGEEEPDLSDPEVLETIERLSQSPMVLYKEMIEILKKRGPDGLTNESKIAFANGLRTILSAQKAGVGVITAEFSLELTYEEYLAFLDYLHSLENLTFVTKAKLWQDIIAATNETREYDFELLMLVVKPIEIPEPNPSEFIRELLGHEIVVEGGEADEAEASDEEAAE